MITRRNFLKAGAAVAALSVVPNGFASILAKKEKAIGVQLYSVRDDLKTDFDGTMKALVDIGYKRMEAAGYRDGKFYGKSPAEMKKYLADLGARMVGSHTGSGLLAEGDTKGWDFWKKNAADTAEVGCKWIVQAGYPSKDIKSLSDVKRLADQFNKCGEIAKANGLRFAFHNHVDEFHELEGKIPFDVMIENTDKGLVLSQVSCLKADKGTPEQVNGTVDLTDNTIYLKVKFSSDANKKISKSEGGHDLMVMCDFSYSLDGKKYQPLGKSFQAKEGKWIGVKVGTFCTRPAITTNDGGWADVDWFRITKK